MKIINIAKKLIPALLMVLFSAPTLADETTAEKVENMKNRSVDKMKETYRDAEDKICKTVNGKLECLPKKIENEGKTVTDKVKTQVKDTKNKLDE